MNDEQKAAAKLRLEAARRKKIELSHQRALVFDAKDGLKFNDDEMAELRAEAKKQAEDEFKALERKRILSGFIAEERARLSPPEPEEPEEEVTITIDVPACCIINKNNDTGVTINGREYIHGRVYSNKEPKESDSYISASRAADIRHIMFRANANEKALGFPNRDMNQKRVINAVIGQIVPMPEVTGGA